MLPHTLFARSSNFDSTEFILIWPIATRLTLLQSNLFLHILKIFYLYCLFVSYEKKSSILLHVFFFLLKKSKTLYSTDLVIADTFLGTAGVRCRQV